MRRRFGSKLALDDVSLEVRNGQIHALLGPNGAGKTTLLRIFSGLLLADSGSTRIAGLDPARNPRALRGQVGLVPSGDRSFYLRISGLENLVFFARMYGFTRRRAVGRSLELLDRVGLAEAARKRVGLYSHGMQKRLGIARALLTDPPVLLVDEATHDLDPVGARRIRELVAALAEEGTAVVWATQRIEEIRGFAARVTVLADGKVRFVGSVPELMAVAVPRRFVVRLRNGRVGGDDLDRLVQRAVGELATLSRVGDDVADDFVLALADGTVLGEAIAAIMAGHVDVLACREEQSEVESAFLHLTSGDGGTR